MKLGKIISRVGNKIVVKLSINSVINSMNLKYPAGTTFDLKTAKRLYGKTVSIDNGRSIDKGKSNKNRDRKNRNKEKIGRIVDIIGRVDMPYLVINLFNRGGDRERKRKIKNRGMIGKFVSLSNNIK